MSKHHLKKPSRSKAPRRLKKGFNDREKLVKRHIDSLFSLVKKNRHSNYTIASRYMWLIRRISMKCNHKLSSDVKRSYCKHCKALFVPGKNCRVRVQRKKVIYSCFDCKNYTRIPYGKTKKN